MKRRHRLFTALIILLLSACHPTIPPPPSPSPSPTLTAETTLPPAPSPTAAATITVTPHVVSLHSPLDRRQVELSGLAWHGESLVLLPQYPTKEGNHLYTLPRAALEAFAATGAPLPPAEPINFDDDGVHMLPGFEGFEAIAFDGEVLYLTIEAHKEGMMIGYLIRGRWEAEGITLDQSTLRPIQPQVNLKNMTDEAIILWDDSVLTLDEANGPQVNPRPIAHRFTLGDLTPMAPLPMAPLEYRITDATAADAEGAFWVVDYLWPGDAEKLHAPTPADHPIEWLVPLRITAAGIIRREDAPILALTLREDGKARNWEGVALLPDYGFILVTDTYPETLLAFAPFPR